VIIPLRRSGMACVLKGSHSSTCTPCVHPLTRWTIPAFAFPAEAGTHLPIPGGGEGGRLRWLWYLLKCTFKVDFYENYLLHVVFSSFYAKGCQLETTTSKERSTVLGSKFESWSEGEDVGTMAKKVVTFRWVCILRIVYNTSFFIRTSVVNKMLSYRRETTLQGAL